MDKDLASVQEVRDMLRKAREAADQFKTFSQDQVDRIVQAMAERSLAAAKRLAEMAVEETGYGRAEDGQNDVFLVVGADRTQQRRYFVAFHTVKDGHFGHDVQTFFRGDGQAHFQVLRLGGNLDDGRGKGVEHPQSTLIRFIFIGAEGPLHADFALTYDGAACKKGNGHQDNS